MSSGWLNVKGRVGAIALAMFIAGLVVGTATIGVYTQPSTPAGAGRGGAALLVPQERAVVNISRDVGPAVVAVRTGTGEERALGSGVIVRPDGYILTSNHVVSSGGPIRVTLSSGQSMVATALGGDPRVDLAVIKIPGRNLPVAQLGDSDALQVGQLAIAIGNPYGFERTVTVGVVSAMNRSIPGGGASLTGLIQTDAEIYPGNSGGPLLDSGGRVIGINTALVSGSSGGGLGFAVPINTAQAIIKSVLSTGRVVVPWIGISYGDVTEQVAKVFGLSSKSGVLVADVVKGGPAAKAGVEKADIIVEANGVKVEDGGDLQKQLKNKKVGDKISLTVLRDSKRQNLAITLEEMPKSAQNGDSS